MYPQRLLTQQSIKFMLPKPPFDNNTINRGLFQFPSSIPEPTTTQSSSFRISLDLKLVSPITVQSITGNIVIQALRQIENRDFRVDFIGSCIRYSQNPFKSLEETDRSITRQESVSEFVADVLTNKGDVEMAVNEEIFLEGSQVVRYVGDNEEQQLETLKEGVYYIPFSFHLPPGSPPSIGMIGFVDVFFSVQYKIVIEQLLSQFIVLEKAQKTTQIEQLRCSTLEFSLRKFCFLCLGQYRMEGIARVVFDIVQIKIQFFRKGEKNDNKPLIKSVKVSLIAQIVSVGKHTVAEYKMILEQLEYGILGGEFKLCNLSKLKLRSYQNQIFHLRYYLELKPETVNYVSMHGLTEERFYLEL